MPAATSQPSLEQVHTDTARSIGGWLFRYRTLVPLPLAAAILLAPEGVANGSAALRIAGLGLVAAGEGLRLWAVRHIGVVSRTRSDRLGPLVTTGPFALMRNPLYLGNIMLWSGLAVAARLLWLAPLIALVLAAEYHFIVRWEEQLLEQRQGDRYREYAGRVARWVPRSSAGGPQRRADRRRSGDNVAVSGMPGGASFSWRETFYSERGTLIAIAVGLLLIYAKSLIGVP
jgi:protein-S-isoprenylcysteine O-methyltransferase Ste14